MGATRRLPWWNPHRTEEVSVVVGQQQDAWCIAPIRFDSIGDDLGEHASRAAQVEYKLQRARYNPIRFQFRVYFVYGARIEWNCARL